MSRSRESILARVWPSKKCRDLAGQRFGRLVVVAYSGLDKRNYAAWRVRCDCGKEHVVASRYLVSGVTRSCGCLAKDVAATRKRPARRATTGKKAVSPEYNSWHGMLARCSNPLSPSYANYGGRGIEVCERWRGSFKTFLADMGPRPIGTSLERKDNEKGYSPDNCRWATRAEQSRNRRTTVFVQVGDERLALKDACERNGVAYSIALRRLQRGWSDAEALGVTPRARVSGKTHCLRGHPLSGANLYIKPDGTRACRECRNAASQRSRERRAE